MRVRAGVFAVAILGGSSAHADAPILLPSGHQAVLLDFLADEGEDSLRLRYLVPVIADATLPYARMVDQVFEDMEWLCETQIRRHFPEAQDQGWPRAVVTMLSEPLDFGVRDVGVVQFFEIFSITGDGCEWDEYDE